MPRFNSFTVPTPHTYVASTTTRVDLPRSGFITHIDHLLYGDITAGGGATALQDGLFRILRATNIRAAGSKTFFNHTDGRLWHYWNHHRYLGNIHVDAVPTAGANNIVRAYVPLHLGFDPLNIYDAKVVIPGRDLQNLVEEIVWGVAADVGAVQTINAMTLTLTINEIALEPGEAVSGFWPAGFLLPRFESRANRAIGVQSNLGFEDDVPVGDTLFHTLVLMLAAATTRSDAEATEIGVKFPKVREIPSQVEWHTFLKQARALFSLPATLTGVVLFPWERVSRDPFGIDLKLAQAGDVKLGFTTILGTGALSILHYALG